MSETPTDSINDQTPSLPEHTTKQILPDTVTMVPDNRSRESQIQSENAAAAAILEVIAEGLTPFTPEPTAERPEANAAPLDLCNLAHHVCASLLTRGADETACMAEAKKTCEVLARIVLSRVMSLRAQTGPDPMAEDHARLASRLRASPKVQRGILKAIVDSGASSHFVTANTHLENVRSPEGAKVMTAGGRTESINEIGDIPVTEGVKMTDCKKVTSFPHSLVSVSKLCMIVGCVAFDNTHVYAVSTKGGKTGKTPIGDVTSNRLYSFDLRALQRHCEEHKDLLPTEGGQTVWPTPDTANLATHIGTIGDVATGHLHAACYEDGTCAVASAVSDVEATKILQMFHQIWGHISAKKMAKLHAQGVDLGGDVSAEQILGLQWWCDACHKSKFTSKGYSKKWKHKPPPEGIRCGQYLVADVIVRKQESIKYHDDRNKRAKGGLKYALYILDEKSKRGFIEFIKNKSDLERALKDLLAHIEMEMRHSQDHDGTTPTILRLTSDRDANITSIDAVRLLLEARIEQRLTATHGTNQTPRLDSAIRQLLNTTRGLLVTAGMGMEWWQFAMSYAVQIENRRPTETNSLGRSPYHCWTGVAPNMSVKRWKTFGCDTHVKLRIEQREGGDKLGAASAGGSGRYRYMGPDIGLGYKSKGDIIFDTKKKRVSIERDTVYNPRMNVVRMLGTPGHKPAPVLKEEEDDDMLAPVGEEMESKEGLPEDSSPGGILSPSTSPPPDPEEDTWTKEYITLKGNETLASIALREGLDVGDLQTRNCYPGTNRCRPAHQRMRKGQGVWLPQPVSEDQDTKSPEPIELEEENLVGRVVYHNVAGYGNFYGLIVEPADAKGRLTIVYTDRDVQLKTRNQLVKGLRPVGSAEVHVEGLQDWYDQWLIDRARELDSANIAYQAHFAFIASERQIRSGPGSARDITGVSGHDAQQDFWDVADDAFEKTFKPRLHKVMELAHAAVHQRNRGTTATRLRLCKAAAERHFDTGTSSYLASLCEQLPHQAHLVKELAHLRCASLPVPKHYRAAIQGEFAKYWQEAIQAEIDNLKKHGVFEWVPYPDRPVKLDSSWVFKAKSNDRGQVSRFKARLVARGFRQTYGHDFVNTMAPVGKLVTFRLAIAEMARRGSHLTVLDISSAYLEAKLDIPQHMKPPCGVSPPKPGWVMKLLKGLYGLKQSGRGWHEKFRKDLKSWGYTQGNADPCLFSRISKKDGTLSRILLFVDDMAIFTDEGSHMLEDLKTNIASKYDCSASDDKMVFLGLAVQKCTNGPHMYHLGQKRYIEDVALKFGIKAEKRIRSPWTGGAISKRDCPDLAPGTNPLQKKYVELVGILRWIERCTRPDLTTVLSELGKVQANPGEVHWHKLLHVLRYVVSTKSVGILFGGPMNDHASAIILGYTDSNWGGSGEDFRARGGYVFCAWQSPIAWSSFKLMKSCLSSCEAEFYAASVAAQEAAWLRYLASDFGYGDLSVDSYGNLCDEDYKRAQLAIKARTDERPMLCWCDNKASIRNSQNPTDFKRSRHIHVRYKMVRDEYNAGHLELVWIPTKENLADLMTKRLTPGVQEYLCKMLVHFCDDGIGKHIDGAKLVGKPHVYMRDALALPDLSEYKLAELRDISHFDKEVDIRGSAKHRPSVRRLAPVAPFADGTSRTSTAASARSVKIASFLKTVRGLDSSRLSDAGRARVVRVVASILKGILHDKTS